MAAQAGHRAPPARQGLWNGTGVAAFLLSGEVLRLRYALDVAQVGLSTAAFGIGLAVGNLSAGALRRLGSGEECALVITNVLLVASVAAFYLPPLPCGARSPVWPLGSILGAGAPLATTVLASRSDRDKGAALAAAETLNNLSILSFLPLAATLLAQGKPTLAATVFLAGLGLGAVLTVHDAVRANRRSSWLAPKKADAELQCQRAGSSRFSSARANKALAQNMS